VRGVLANHPGEKTTSLPAISVSNLEKQSVVQLELPLGLEDEARRPGAKKGATLLFVLRGHRSPVLVHSHRPLN
jgi:hypothetical protein